MAWSMSPALTSATRTSSGAIGRPAASALVQPSRRWGMVAALRLNLAPLLHTHGLPTVGLRQFHACAVGR